MMESRRAHREPQKPSRPARLLGYVALCLALLACGPAAANPELGVTIDLAALSPAARAAEVGRIAAGGARSLRMPLDWNLVEPARGAFRWQPSETAVETARAGGLEVMLVLGPAARWSVDPALGLPPAVQPLSLPQSAAVWEEYVRHSAARLGGDVRQWQVREQPNGANFRGAVWPEYARLFRAAARAIRAQDPGATVILPEALPLDVSGLDRWLNAPEATDWTVYGAYLPAPADLPRSALRLAVMTWEVNPLAAGSARPVWVVGAEGPLPADAWLQYYLLCAAFGVARVYLPADVLDAAWDPRLSAMRYLGFLHLGPAVWALVFEDDRGPVVAAWSTVPTTLPAADLAQAAQPDEAVLLTLGPRPTLLRGLAAAARMHPGAPTRAQVLAARDLPDCTALPAVSVDYNRSDRPELGLYHRALRGLPGGASRLEERAGRLAIGTALGGMDQEHDVPWLYFDVDDSWLYFAQGRTKVAITVECQEAARAQTVGFVIRYDSTRGTKTARWQWVDQGSGWRRYTTVLEDADFTGRPGYDFVIDAAAGKADLWVSSVTVEKLPPAIEAAQPPQGRLPQ